MDRPVGGARELCHLGRAARPRVQPLERQTVHRAVLPAMAVMCSPWELLVRPQAHGEDEPCTTTGWVPEHPASGVSYSARVLVEHRPPLLRGSGGARGSGHRGVLGCRLPSKTPNQTPARRVWAPLQALRRTPASENIQKTCQGRQPIRKKGNGLTRQGCVKLINDQGVPIKGWSETGRTAENSLYWVGTRVFARQVWFLFCCRLVCRSSQQMLRSRLVIGE
jgi:hypothetical protein